MKSVARLLQAAAVVAGASIFSAISLAGGQESSVLVPRPVSSFLQPALPAPARPVAQTVQPTVIDESVAAPQSQSHAASPSAAHAAVVHPAPCIVYDTDRGARKMYACSGSMEMIMVTCNPANGCQYEIPLCIPGCCTGEPTVTSRCGLFGRGVVEYCWPCGFSATVKFRNIGDIKVDYDG